MARRVGANLHVLRLKSDHCVLAVVASERRTTVTFVFTRGRLVTVSAVLTWITVTWPHQFLLCTLSSTLYTPRAYTVVHITHQGHF